MPPGTILRIGLNRAGYHIGDAGASISNAGNAGNNSN